LLGDGSYNLPEGYGSLTLEGAQEILLQGMGIKVRIEGGRISDMLYIGEWLDQDGARYYICLVFVHVVAFGRVPRSHGSVVDSLDSLRLNPQVNERDRRLLRSLSPVPLRTV